jgi:hypothetical protein
VQHHLGAEAARALDLHHRRALRHHDHRAQPSRCAWCATPWAWLPAEAAITPLRPRGAVHQRGQLVERAALLERGGELQVLELQEDRGSR